jgi:amino acid transporter
MPAWLNRIHPVHRTPYTAVIAQTVLALIVGVVGGGFLAPDQSFFMLGTLATIIYVFVYLMGNIGVARFFLTTARRDMNVLIHIIFPIVSTIALCFVLYYSLVPLPDPPVSYAPIAFGILLVVGLLMLWRLQRSGRTNWKTLSRYVVDSESSAPSRDLEVDVRVRKLGV